MNVAVLNAAGPLPELQRLAAALGMVPSSTHQMGQAQFGGKLHSSDGLQLEIADAANPVDLSRLVAAFIAKCTEHGVSFGAETSAELSIGFTVGDSAQYIAGFKFLPEELRAISERGISLNITAYPTSDEANGNESAI